MVGAALVPALTSAGCASLNPTADWPTIFPALKKRLPQPQVIKISGDQHRLDVLDTEGTVHTWRNGTWSQREATPEVSESLTAFDVDAFDLGDVDHLLNEYEANSLVARKEVTYLQPVLTLDGSRRTNLVSGMTPVPVFDYTAPEGVDHAVQSLAKAALISPVSVALAQQNESSDAVFFFGLRENKPIYLFRRADMPVQWVGSEPSQDYRDLPSFNLPDVNAGALATALQELRERGSSGELTDAAATWYSFRGQPTLAVEANFNGQRISVVADRDGHLPADFQP